LTGVLADKHGVRDNAFQNHKLAEYPNFLRRFKLARPDAQTAALVSWKPFQDCVFGGDAWCRLVLDGDVKGYEDGDRQVAAAAVRVLAKEDPDALFVYFGCVDVTGHGYGFHPRSPKYTNSIEAVDVLIGDVLTALRGRKTYPQEDWLVIACTDHGGRGREHGIGKGVPEIRTGFVLLYGPAVRPGRIRGKTCNADVAATALAHLGVETRPEWNLDGKPVGLK
jgi:predicted AlkP superfamily pyrophosphatase or phosphodiesterase